MRRIYFSLLSSQAVNFHQTPESAQPELGPWEGYSSRSFSFYRKAAFVCVHMHVCIHVCVNRLNIVEHHKIKSNLAWFGQT